MPLPPNFPKVPKRPPWTEPLGSPAWLQYFDAIDRLELALVSLASGAVLLKGNMLPVGPTGLSAGDLYRSAATPNATVMVV